jgi:hypothetical protein
MVMERGEHVMAQSQQQEKTRSEQTSAADHAAPAAQATPSSISTSSLSAALSQLPQQYFKAIFKPSVATYAQSKEQASWALVWIQLLAWAVLDAALGVLVNLISPPATGASFSLFSFATSYGLVLIVPALFFLLTGIVYALAKLLGGQGTFLELCNASLSVQAPLGIGSKLLALIPVVGRILNSVLSLYGIVLQVIVIMAAQRLGKGKAIATLLIPLVVAGVLAALFFLLIKK